MQKCAKDVDGATEDLGGDGRFAFWRLNGEKGEGGRAVVLAGFGLGSRTCFFRGGSSYRSPQLSKYEPARDMKVMKEEERKKNN